MVCSGDANGHACKGKSSGVIMIGKEYLEEEEEEKGKKTA